MFLISSGLIASCSFTIFYSDNISDGMMTRETDVLSDVVMNALWFSDKYMPTKARGKEQAVVELNPGKLAREYVIFFNNKRIRN